MFRANTTITVLRGRGTDRFGDETDLDQVAYTNVPAWIAEQTPNSRSRQVDGRTDQVRAYTLRVLGDITFQRGDRVRDERDGSVYMGDFEILIDNVAGHRTRRMTVRKVT